MSYVLVEDLDEEGLMDLEMTGLSSLILVLLRTACGSLSHVFRWMCGLPFWRLKAP
jgi:hypothetical protein